MSRPRLLLVEDEQGLRMTLEDAFRSEGYEVETAENGEQALELTSRRSFQVIVLDVMLPGQDGFGVCRELRRRGDSTPILMLTARGQLMDKVQGLQLGADDYLTKPFETLELLARIEALRRRGKGANLPRKQYRFGRVEIDFQRTEVRKDGRAVELSPREFQLLGYFVQHPEITLSRRRLLREVWDYPGRVLTRTVDVHVGLLRQKLEDDPKHPRYFLTVRGFGYKFVPHPRE